MLTFCLLHSKIMFPRFRVCFLGNYCNILCPYWFYLFLVYCSCNWWVNRFSMIVCFLSSVSLFRIFAILLPWSHNYPWCLVQSEDEVAWEGTEPRSRAYKKGRHFWQKNRPKMNLEEIVEEEFVQDLVKRKLCYQAISERLQALYPGRFGTFSLI